MEITDGNVWIAYWASNAFGLVTLCLSAWSPRVGRWIFFLMFAWACWVNWSLALNSPSVYLDYAKHALPLYASFIRGFFAEHITAFVAAIATGQGLIALGMIGRGWMVKWACAGAMVFLLAIAPLGFFAAFPFSLIVSWAAWLVFRSKSHEPLVFSRRRRAAPPAPLS